MKYNNNLCPKLKGLYIESYKEVNIDKKEARVAQSRSVAYLTSYAIYPKRFYKNINNSQNKIYDFIFIGGLLTDNATYLNRKWILTFIKENFNNNSYLQFTDKETKKQHTKLGNYDYSHKTGFVPKEVQVKDRNFFDIEYFNNLSKSKFCLCPAGDSIYSMRFYEALMCKCIPIVKTFEETFRSKEESKLDYKYYLTTSINFIYRRDWVEHNYKIFLQYHTLEYFYNTIHLFGMRRSRLHLISDVIKNKYNTYKFYNNFGDGPIMNNGKEGELLKDSIINMYKKNIKDVIILFEDKLYSIENDNKILNIIIIRDIYDVIISRIHKNEKWSEINQVFINTHKKILKEVLNIDNNIKNKLVVDTDKFISDKTYRDNLLGKINITDYSYDINNISQYGGGKTFTNNENRMDVKIPITVINILEKDKEFINLIKQYYNYNIISKLQSNVKSSKNLFNIDLLKSYNNELLKGFNNDLLYNFNS